MLGVGGLDFSMLNGNDLKDLAGEAMAAPDLAMIVYSICLQGNIPGIFQTQV